jgi:GAF domain-containing protein
MHRATPPAEQSIMARQRACRILDDRHDMRFDRIVFSLAQMVRTPMALIAFVDLDHVWIKARVGLPERAFPHIDRFIATLSGSDDISILNDARGDRRFADAGCGAGQARIRFHAGAEIHAVDGLPRGVLCVFDTRRRSLTEEERAGMRILAREAEALIRNGSNEPSRTH